MAAGTGGAQAPDSYTGGNTHQGNGNTRRKRKHPPGKPYRWDNGTYHTRPQGKKFRSNYGDNDEGGNGTGGSQAPTTPRVGPYLSAARNEANLEYGGIENSLRDRGLAIPTWFENYRNQVAQQQAASNAYAAPIVAGAQQQAQAAGQVAPGVDPNSQAGQDATLAAAARAALGNSFVTMLQGFGQVQNQYLEGRKTVASTAELGAQQDLARDRADVKREKGQFIRKRRGELKDEAHQRRLENAAFGLKASDAAADNARQDQQDKQNRQDKLGAVNRYGITEKKWRQMSQAERQKVIRRFDKSDGKPKNGQGFTPKQQSDARKNVRSAMSLVRSELHGRKTAPAGFWQKALDALINNKGYDPLIARAAIQILRDGQAKPGTAKRVRRDYGIGLPKGKPLSVPPAYVLTPPAPALGATGEFRPT